MLHLIGAPATLALMGLAGGIVLGLAARVGRFCSLGAIEDALYGGDGTRLRMWGVAVGTAIVGAHALIGLGLLSPGETPYLALTWMPLASLLGGTIFGYGMALAGACGYGALARAGGGDMRAFVIVLVMGIAAYVTLSGHLALARTQLFPAYPADTLQGLPWLLERRLGLAPTATGTAIGTGLLAASLASRPLLRRPARAAWGAAAGLAVVSGWAGTQWVARASLGETGVISHSFSAPMGETLLYLMTASGNTVSFGVGSVAGVLLGALIGSLRTGRFRWEACEDPRELRRQILGAALMGVGAVVAMGCTIGQGLSAFALLSYSAPVTLAAIFAGAALGLRQLLTGFVALE